MSKRILENLSLQLFVAVLLSLFLGMFVFGISFLAGDRLLDQTIYGQSFAKRMADQQFLRLQEFVDDEAVSLGSLQRLNAWCSRGEKVYLAIYQGDAIIYESLVSSRNRDRRVVQEYDPNLEDPESEYLLTLNGDVKVRAFLYYYAGDAFYFFMVVLSGLLSFVSFSLCFILLISRKVAYISLLKQELDILSGGQLEYPVTVSGKDELAKLAAGIDQMRKSIMNHQEMEEQMRAANLELITAISHDLRTPLTSLLAYLEIMERKKYADEKQLHSLIHKSVRQSMRIKKMADELFSYFIAYATEPEAAGMETIDADQLFQQIFGDYVFALESKGMRVDTDFEPLSAQISVNPEQLQRALDNLYSNLLKYADPAEKIRISYGRTGGSIRILISNKTAGKQADSESTGLGLVTCRRIIEYHHGRLLTEANNGFYCVSITMPLQE